MYPKALFDFIASITPAHNSAWDCATGNGQAALGLAEFFGSVQASDISEAQISNAFAADNINYSVQASEATQFSDNQFDLVNVAQALHWFDYQRYWDEVSRVLNPEGVFVAYSYVWPSLNAVIDELVEEKIKQILEPYWADNNRLAWNEYRELEFPFTPLDVPAITLQNHWNADQFFNYLHSWSGTRRCIDDKGLRFFEEAKEALRIAWGNPARKIVVKHPLVLIAGKAWS